VKSIIAVLALVLLSGATRADGANVMVMGLDAAEQNSGSDIGVVARDTRVFRQILEAIGDELEHEGFDIFDERAVTLDHFKQQRTGRSEAELLDIARSVQRPPIDAVVIFTAYAGARRLAYTTDIYTRITGRIVNVRTGQKIGGFEVTSPRGWKAPIGCEGDCLLEVISGNVKTMGGELGVVLAQQLATVVDKTDRATPLPTGYTLVFGGFTADDITGVEEYLAAFRGYKLHRPIATSPRSVGYWYEIDSDSARLSRNLRMMLERLGADARITFSGTDNTFTVEKTTEVR